MPTDPTELEAAAKAATLTEADITRAEELLRDPDAEDNERFASWYGRALRSERLALLARVGELEGERDRLKALCESPWSDREDEHTPAINAAHPETTKDHNTYWTALQMVGARRGKYELVNLTNWLLARALSAEVTLRASQEALAPFANAADVVPVRGIRRETYTPSDDEPYPSGPITWGMVRAARQTLAQIRGVGEEQDCIPGSVTDDLRASRGEGSGA